MDVAGVVVFLASSAAFLITGETILIDGGWTAHVGEYSSLARHLRRNYVARRRSEKSTSKMAEIHLADAACARRGLLKAFQVLRLHVDHAPTRAIVDLVPHFKVGFR
jgi:hypothetical protein